MSTDFAIKSAILELRRLAKHWDTGGSAKGAMVPLEQAELYIRQIRANLEAHIGD